jgi:hypothetical protein
MRVSFRWNDSVSLAHGSGRAGRPAGWATVCPPELEATVWRTGRGAGTLAVLFMPAAETEAACLTPAI